MRHAFLGPTDRLLPNACCQLQLQKTGDGGEKYVNSIVSWKAFTALWNVVPSDFLKIPPSMQFGYLFIQ